MLCCLTDGEKSNTPTCAVSFKRLLGRSPGHELIKELARAGRTRDLKGDRPPIRLRHHYKPEEAAAAALRFEHRRECGEEIVGRRETPAIAIRDCVTVDRARQQARQEPISALLELSRGECASYREFGHLWISP